MAPTILLVTTAAGRTADLEQALRLAFPDARIESTRGSLSFAELSAIARRDPPPRAVLVDFSAPEQGAQLLAKVRVALPRAIVAAFCPQATPAVRAAADRGGRIDVLTAPYRLGPLASQVARAMRPGRLVAFVPAQGGCGASTIALHVAATIAGELPKESRGVCLVDFDFQAGTLAFRLRLKPQLRVTDLLAAPATIPRILPQAAVNWRGLNVLAAPESEISAAAGEATPLLIDALRERYEFVLLDLPAALYASCRDALQRDAEAFLVTTTDATPLHLAERRAQELLELGVAAERIHVLYNRAREQPGPEFLHPAMASLGAGTCIPNDYRTLNTAVLSGELAAPDMPVAKAYVSLAKRVLDEELAAPGVRG